MKELVTFFKPLTILMVIVTMAFVGCEQMDQISPLDSMAGKKGKGNAPVAASSTLNNCSVSSKTDEMIAVADLVAGQHNIVGEVTVYREIGNGDFKLVYEITEPGCTITEFQAYAGDISGLPANNKGCPKIGHFPFKASNISETSFCVSLGQLPAGMNVVAAHAVVSCSGSGMNFSGETAWAAGPQFKGCNNWGMYMEFSTAKTPPKGKGGDDDDDEDTSTIGR